ncbi:MAG: MarC family protein [Gammaproteobacteria bacterium]|nr:MarC family protein [Gammaproteobacteria bacterium]NNC98485.1 MarC family protein [Gammaproteobacteria bacterium]NNM13098.1 MarC family protein [Gammaproteobacteria bacterium]
MIEQLVNTFIILFVVVDPIALAPIFGAMTRGGSDAYKKKMAFKATILSTMILLLFLFIGNHFLKAMGITIPAFKIAGGLLLLVNGFDMVFARHTGLRSTTVKESAEARQKDDISVFPLAFPLIAGPGTITTVLLLSTEMSDDPVLFASLLGMILLVLALALIFLLLSGRVMKILGETGANVLDRLLGVILCALAIQFMIDGVRSAFGL